MAPVRQVPFPAESQLRPSLGQAFYSDAFEADLIDPDLTPVEIATRAFASAPAWADGLLWIRDRIVSLFGLKTVGRLRLAVDGRRPLEPAVGDTFSIFRVVSLDRSELVLGIDDTHLDVRILFLKRQKEEQASYVVGAWVRTHNALGRVYMLPVAPIHRLLVRRVMRGVPM